MGSTRASIVATGSSFPAKTRTNEDPIFDWLRAHPPKDDMFTGLKNRQVLDDGESIVPHMIKAANQALGRSGLEIGDIDLVLGYCSVSTWDVPNDLMLVAKELGVNPSTPIIPVSNFYSNFSASLGLADAMLVAGRATNALIVVGSNWTQYVSYQTPEALAAGDAAGAAVLCMAEEAERFSLTATSHFNALEYFGGMYMTGDTGEADAPWGPTIYHIDPLGHAGFGKVAVPKPVELVQALLDTHGVAADGYHMISYQASNVLYDAWRTGLKLQDGQLLENLANYGDMVTANIAANLDVFFADISFNNLVLLDMGPEISVSASLYQRPGATA